MKINKLNTRKMAAAIWKAHSTDLRCWKARNISERELRNQVECLGARSNGACIDNIDWDSVTRTLFTQLGKLAR